MSQLQYNNENQLFISNFGFQFIKIMKWHFQVHGFNPIEDLSTAENYLSPSV